MRRLPLLVLVPLLFISGCDLIGDIFEAGLVVGIIVVVIVLAIVGWLVGKFRGKGGGTGTA